MSSEPMVQPTNDVSSADEDNLTSATANTGRDGVTIVVAIGLSA
jgi:hypothetical protein